MASESQTESEAQSRVGKAAQQAADAIRQGADHLKSSGLDMGQRLLEKQKAAATAELERVEEAIRAAGKQLRGESGASPVSGYTDAAADQIGRVRHYLDESDAGTIIDDIQDLVRRHPKLVLGGMFVAGVAIGRFLRASSEQAGTADAQFDEFDEFDDMDSSPDGEVDEL